MANQKVRVRVSQLSSDMGKDFAFLPHSDELYPDLISAAMAAGKKIGKGVMVSIEPTYNEFDNNGEGMLRLWRSWNGDPFIETRYEGDKPQKTNEGNISRQKESDDEPTVKLFPKIQKVLEMGDLK